MDTRHAPSKYLIDDLNTAEVNLKHKHKGVCPLCKGNGKFVNPSIDDNGISPEQFAEDPEFEESYFSGDYDVTCWRCDGIRVVDVPDEGVEQDLEDYNSALEAIDNYFAGMNEERYLRGMDY